MESESQTVVVPESDVPGNTSRTPSKRRTRQKRSGTPRNVEAKLRQRQGIALRAAGATWQDIADALDYASASSARSSVMGALSDQLHEAGAELVQLQYERLNTLLLSRWDEAVRGDDASLDRVLAIMREMNRIKGVDQADFTQINVDARVLVVEGDESAYVAGLQALRGDKTALGPGEDFSNLQPDFIPVEHERVVDDDQVLDV